MITVTSLHRYPVKGLRGIDVSSAKVMSRGFEYDREWMIVDSNNKFVTQRDANAMATISTTISEEFLILEHESLPAINIPLEPVAGTAEEVVVWKDTCTAIDQGEESAAWLSKALEVNKLGPVRLMRFDQNGRRSVDPKFLGGTEAEVGFADGYPYLLANENTLAALNEQLAEPVPMNRFRPNIVVDQLPALDEHKLNAITIENSNIRMTLPKPCQRCKVTTIDQHTGNIAESREPLRTLVRTNPFDHLVGGYFGQNAIAVSGLGEELKIGDRLNVHYT